MDNVVNNLAEVFCLYKKYYIDILKCIWPSIDSNGFQERNLTVNFTNAYKEIAKNNNEYAIVWFEFQCGDNGKKHVDALLMNTTSKEIFVIEAKRYNNVNQKIKSVAWDVRRIQDFFCNKDKLVSRLGDISDYQFYGMILADVWCETASKIEVAKLYNKKSFFEEKLCNINLGSETEFYLTVPKSLQYDIQTFEEQKNANTDKYENMDKDIPSSLNKYNLVSFWWPL